jgi:hypothetical protein
MMITYGGFGYREDRTAGSANASAATTAAAAVGAIVFFAPCPWGSASGREFKAGYEQDVQGGFKSFQQMPILPTGRRRSQHCERHPTDIPARPSFLNNW